jgi:hypothetical protein
MSQFNNILFSQPKADFSSSLIGHWSFDEGTGTTTADSSSNRFPMTMSISHPTWITGKVGSYALNFVSASNQYLTHTGSNPALNSLFSSQSLSMTAWFRTSTIPTQSMTGICISNGGQLQGQYDKGLGIQSNGKVGFYYFSGGAHICSGTSTVTDGNWHHLCATFNGQEFKVYVDGKLEGTRFEPSTFQFTNGFLVASFHFGTGGSLGTWDAYNGDMDDIRVYNRALSSADIQALYAYSSNDLTTGLLLYFKFDEGSGSIANDSSGTGRNGSLANSPAYVSGKIGPYALKTSTINDHIDVSPILMTGSWTISTWTNFPQPVTFNNSLTRNGAASGSGNVHVYMNNHTLGCYVATAAGFYTSGYSTSGLSGWHHLTAVGSASKTTFYIDGVNVGTSSNQATDNLDTIGNNIQDSNQPWGTFDDFRIYNRALSTTDIQYLYNFR